MIGFFSFHPKVNGQKVIKVYTDGNGSDTVQQVISILSKELAKSGSYILKVSRGEMFSGKGILVSALPEKWSSYAGGLKKLGAEGVIVKSLGGQGIVIIGNSQLAIQHGVFIYLQHLGYRYFMPHPDWYIIPASIDPFSTANYAEEPSFVHRRIWYSYGTGSKKADEDYKFWYNANRLGTSVYANFGHAYDDIVYRNWDVFKLHPEWFFPRLNNTTKIPDDPKFNLADESLVQFIISDALKVIESRKKSGNQGYKMISMVPSDGLGTCSSPECFRLGATITDRVYYLVNRVAKAIRQKYPDVWVGGMSYSEYAAPPTIKLEPNTYVNIATAFNYTKYSTDELIRLWSNKAGKTGIYDYLSLYNWDWDVPGQSQASRVEEYTNTLKKFYKLGIRGFEAESNVGIGKGLGHYITAKLLWNINDDIKKSKSEFFSLSFGKVATEIQKIWEEWEKNPFSFLRDKDLARWIDIVYASDNRNTDLNVKKRLFHIKSYLYYLVLYRNLMIQKTEETRITLLSYSFRMTDYASFAGYPALWDLGNGTGLPGFSYNDPDAKYKKNKSPVTENEIEQGLQKARSGMRIISGLQSFPLTNSFRIAPCMDKWKGYTGDGTNDQNAFWMGADFVIKISKQGKENYIDFDGGYVKGIDKPTRMKIYNYNISGKPSGVALMSYEYNLEMKKDRVSLEQLKPGYYIVNIGDPGKIFKPKFSPALAYSLIISPTQQLKGTYANHLFIYVPKGVKKFSVFKYEAKFETPTGRIVDLANKVVEEAEVTVQAGEEGLWKLTFFSGGLYFEGLPPVMGPVANRMLIPDNVN